MSADDLKRLRQMSQDMAELAEAATPAGSPSPAGDSDESTYAMGAMATRQWRAEAVDAFGELREAKEAENYPHTQKMIDTIVALVDAKLAGMAIEEVFDRPDTCARATYYNKWKHDPHFDACYKSVLEIAQHWHDNRAANALADAHERLALATPAMVALAVETALKANKMGDFNAVLRAAFGILDRADDVTAQKGSASVEHAISYIREVRPGEDDEDEDRPVREIVENRPGDDEDE